MSDIVLGRQDSPPMELKLICDAVPDTVGGLLKLLQASITYKLFYSGGLFEADLLYIFLLLCLGLEVTSGLMSWPPNGLSITLCYISFIGEHNSIEISFFCRLGL